MEVLDLQDLPFCTKADVALKTLLFFNNHLLLYTLHPDRNIISGGGVFKDYVIVCNTCMFSCAVRWSLILKSRYNVYITWQSHDNHIICYNIPLPRFAHTSPMLTLSWVMSTGWPRTMTRLSHHSRRPLASIQGTTMLGMWVNGVYDVDICMYVYVRHIYYCRCVFFFVSFSLFPSPLSLSLSHTLAHSHTHTFTVWFQLTPCCCVW